MPPDFRVMPANLCLLSCQNFHQEVDAGVVAEGWEDVVSVAFPVRCGRPPMRWDELRLLLPADCTQVILLGRACMHRLDAPPADFPPTRILRVEQCFHLIAGQHLVDEAIADGGYLITPVWLANWRVQLNEMGFAADQAGEFFRDFAKELVLLDTGIDPEALSRLAELGDAVKLPVRRIAVGLDHTRLLLARLVLEWRLERERTTSQARSLQHAGELADHVAAMDMLLRLAKTQHESDAIAAIEDLFRMLFAPAAIHYLRVENDVAIPRTPIPDDMRAAMLGLRDQAVEYTWTPDTQGFLLRIGHGDALLGLVAVDRVAFPNYLERYLNMALAVTGVCGVAIDNARNRQKLLEAEKMASLGIVVAGVAHEINTPLGISLTATSTLQRQSDHLAQRFASRSMTQSDLDTYLQRAQEETTLIQGNLERIGHLVDAFRQIAVGGQPDQKQRFRLKDCLDDVIRSLGDRFPAERIDLHIDCDPGLEIESVQGDWVSIFINLIGNSLKHGFKNRQRGAIDIRVGSDEKWLRVDYNDDGIGLSDEAKARVFDPFFTTDLQQGTGLGMHLVYNLITQHLGGAIQCESQPGQGAHFHIEVPR